jgi:TonB family protein
MEGLKVFSDPSVQIPFAFFKRIYLPAGMGPDSTDGSLAIAHEKAHIDGGHHLDNLIMILARIVLWFHPAIPVLHRQLRLAHELEVDSRVIQQSDPYDYASLLVKYSSGRPHFQWVSPFAQSVTEKRLHMILTQSNVMKRPAKLLFGLALLTGLAWFTSCQEKSVDTLSEDLPDGPKEELPFKGEAMSGNGDDQVYRVVEQMPLFPGCQDQKMASEELTKCAQGKMLDFIYENLKYPEDAKEEGVEGTTVVQFVVDKDGYTRDFTLARGIHPSCDEESLRVLRRMQEKAIRWEPGIQNGKKVHVQMTLPIRYALQ